MQKYDLYIRWSSDKWINDPTYDLALIDSVDHKIVHGVEHEYITFYIYYEGSERHDTVNLVRRVWERELFHKEFKALSASEER